MKQAKQQQQDLRQTDGFLTGLMKPGALEKEKEKEREKQKHSPTDSTSSRQVNGRPKMPRMDSFSRFSDPPAPPPQQPLPEKPDALPRNGVDVISPLKRSDTEKPKMSAGSSPVSRESSQILSLIEALSSAKREIDSQGARVKELESLLLQERHARESAEEKAKSLELVSIKESEEPQSTSELSQQLDRSPQTASEGEKSDAPLVNGIISPVPEQNNAAVEDQTDRLQRRLETMMGEMEEMKKQLSSYKDRAEKAETESNKARKSLAEMIEELRKERSHTSDKGVEPMVEPTRAVDASSPQPDDESATTIKKVEVDPQHAVSSPGTKVLELPGSTDITHRPRDAIEQTSPFASMLGVVLLGVGLMAYLNGWQKMDD